MLSSTGAEAQSNAPSVVLKPELTLVQGRLRDDVQVVVQGGRIARVEPRQGSVEMPGRLLTCGFVNAHSHAFQRGLRGHTHWSQGADSFWTWRDRMYRLANELDPQGIRDVSALAYMEMLQAGFTSVGEFHYLHHMPDGKPYDDLDHLAKQVCGAAEDVGLRVCLLRVAYRRAGANRPALMEQQRFVDRDADAVLDAVRRLERWSDDRDLVSVGLAPHSVRAVPREWLEAFSDYEGVIHAHVSEQPRENTECHDEHGMSPTALMHACGLLHTRFSAVHMTWPRGGDAALFSETGARVLACPTTELDLGDGFLQVDQLPGVPLCIGTDSHAQIDPLAELRGLELHARGCQGRRNVLSTEDPDGLALRLLDAGTLQGARALGMDTGRIAPGALADLITLDITDTALACSRLLPALVMAGHPRLVRDVWVHGRQVVHDGVHAQQIEVVERARAALDRVG
jgi:formimidoylglutamate deiminase